jgi:hypothetical protein
LNPFFSTEKTPFPVSPEGRAERIKIALWAILAHRLRRPKEGASLPLGLLPLWVWGKFREGVYSYEDFINQKNSPSGL